MLPSYWPWLFSLVFIFQHSIFMERAPHWIVTSQSKFTATWNSITVLVSCIFLYSGSQFLNTNCSPFPQRVGFGHVSSPISYTRGPNTPLESVTSPKLCGGMWNHHPNQLRAAHSAKQELGGCHWLCDNSLCEDTLHKQRLPGCLRGNLLQLRGSSYRVSKPSSPPRPQAPQRPHARKQSSPLHLVAIRANVACKNGSWERCLRRCTTFLCLKAGHMWPQAGETRSYWRAHNISLLPGDDSNHAAGVKPTRRTCLGSILCLSTRLKFLAQSLSLPHRRLRKSSILSSIPSPNLNAIAPLDENKGSKLSSSLFSRKAEVLVFISLFTRWQP